MPTPLRSDVKRSDQCKHLNWVWNNLIQTKYIFASLGFSSSYFLIKKLRTIIKPEKVSEDFFKLFVLLADREGSLENRKVFIFLRRKLSLCCFFPGRVRYRRVGQPSELGKLHRLVIFLIKTKLLASGVFSSHCVHQKVLLRLFRGFIINETKFVRKFNCLRPDYTFVLPTFCCSFT